MNKKIIKEEWIKDTSVLFFQIFSGSYNEKFLEEILKGGGGNSYLCGLWMKLCENFNTTWVSSKAILLLKNKGLKIWTDNSDFNEFLEQQNVSDEKFDLYKNCTFYLSKKDYNANKRMFHNNAKGEKNRKEKGKFFHFDHCPSNKHVINEIKKEVKTLLEANMLEKEAKVKSLEDYIAKIQTINLITVEQDDIITKSDRIIKNSFPKNIREAILDDRLYKFKII